MKAGWQKKRLADVCKIKPPKSEARLKLVGAELVSFVPMENMGIGQKYLIPTLTRPLAEVSGSYTYFADGDVLLAKITPCFENGKLGIAANLENGIGFGSSEYIVFRSDESLNKEWLYYFLSRESFREEGAARMSGAVGHKRVSKEFIENYKIPIPPLPEQHRIVAILDEAFENIASAKANAEQNLKNARELFETYLQDFFENPKHDWEIKKWGELCHFVRGPFGGSLKKSIFRKDGYVVYEQKHAIHDHFNQLRYFIDEAKFNEMIRFEVKPGDIIMSCSGVTLGKVAIIPENIQRGIINQALLKLTPKNNVSVNFLKHWLRSRIFQKIIFDYSGGAAIPNVPSAKILKDILIPIPSIKEQKNAVSAIELMLSETQRLESIYKQKIAVLDELKKALLHKAFAGEL